ncbi:MAG: glycosyltransferase family 2 protein [Methylotetracoccus sp.]
MTEHTPADERITIVLPARNEAPSLRRLLPEIQQRCPEAEILLIDDGSTDETGELAKAAGVQVVRHPYSVGNGAAVKSGARHAEGDILVFMDADGQHDPADIPRLLERLAQGYEMVIGARSGSSHASWSRRGANFLYNRLASVMTGYRVEDLTSGFRAVRASSFRRYLYLLPNGFSYPTTITMAFFRSGLPVAYIPIQARRRPKGGRSKIRMMPDGARFFLIILKIGALFSPMRLFLPISGLLFAAGVSLYGYTYLTDHRFTNMAAVLFLSALFTFLIGILSEQVASLHYRNVERDR